MAIILRTTEKQIVYANEGEKARVVHLLNPNFMSWSGRGVHIMKAWMESLDDPGKNGQVALVSSVDGGSPNFEEAGVGGHAMRVKVYLKKIDGEEVLVRDEEQWDWGSGFSIVPSNVNWLEQPVGGNTWTLPGSPGPQGLDPGRWRANFLLRTIAAKSSPQPQTAFVEFEVRSWRAYKAGGAVLPGNSSDIAPKLYFNPEANQRTLLSLLIETLPERWDGQLLRYTVEIKKEGSSPKGSQRGVVVYSKSDDQHTSPVSIEGSKWGFKLRLEWNGRANRRAVLQGQPTILPGSIVPAGRYTVSWKVECPALGLTLAEIGGPVLTTGKIILDEITLPKIIDPFAPTSGSLVQVDARIRALPPEKSKEIPTPLSLWFEVHRTRMTNDDSPMLNTRVKEPGQYVLHRIDCSPDEPLPSPSSVNYFWTGGEEGPVTVEHDTLPPTMFVGRPLSGNPTIGPVTVQLAARAGKPAFDNDPSYQKTSVRARTLLMNLSGEISLKFPTDHGKKNPDAAKFFFPYRGPLQILAKLQFGPPGYSGRIDLAPPVKSEFKCRIYREADYVSLGLGSFPTQHDFSRGPKPLYEGATLINNPSQGMLVQHDWNGRKSPGIGGHPYVLGPVRAVVSAAFSIEESGAQPVKLEPQEIVLGSTELRAVRTVVAWHDGSNALPVNFGRVAQDMNAQGIDFEFHLGRSPIQQQDPNEPIFRVNVTFTPDGVFGADAHNTGGEIFLYVDKIGRKSSLVSHLFGVHNATVFASTNALLHEFGHALGGLPFDHDTEASAFSEYASLGSLEFGFGRLEAALLILNGELSDAANWWARLRPQDQAYAHQYRVGYMNSRGSGAWNNVIEAERLIANSSNPPSTRWRRDRFAEFASDYQTFKPFRWNMIRREVSQTLSK